MFLKAYPYRFFSSLIQISLLLDYFSYLILLSEVTLDNKGG